MRSPATRAVPTKLTACEHRERTPPRASATTAGSVLRRNRRCGVRPTECGSIPLRPRRFPEVSLRPSTPIELRIPNAAPLVGREREYRRVRALAIERRVAIVTGPGGIGKTHLAVRTVHDALGADVGRALYIGCRSAERGALGTAVLRALLGEPPCAIAWTPQTMIAAIDFADREELWIVLDDLHEAP